MGFNCVRQIRATRRLLNFLSPASRARMPRCRAFLPESPTNWRDHAVPDVDPRGGSRQRSMWPTYPTRSAHANHVRAR